MARIPLQLNKIEGNWPMMKVLSNSYLRASGAMLRACLGEEVLVFAYPFPFKRIFTTWLCPPLRILCFDDNGTLIYNKVIDKWRLVGLPETRLVLEVDPEFAYENLVGDVGRLGIDQWVEQNTPNSKVVQNAGGAATEDPYGELLLRLISESMAELGAVKELFNESEPLKGFKKLPLWRRGQIISAASFVLDIAPVVPYQIPTTALMLSKNLMANEDKNDQTELIAAAIAGLPWKFDSVCFRCGHGGRWRQILKPSGKIPKVSQWRLARPENHVPMCFQCEKTVSLDDAELAVALGYGYWGCRFESFHRWFTDAKSGKLPCDWDLDDFPLWPREYGGGTWATGSGNIRHCAPRLGKVVRKKEHIQTVYNALNTRNARWTNTAMKGELYILLRR